MGRMDPNAEQRAIIAASKSARKLKVTALAGTGKTSTLELVAEANPYVRYLYVAYNRAIKDEAATRFPKNVRCVTGHGMVYRQYGTRYGTKLNGGRVPAHQAASILGLQDLRVAWCVSCNKDAEDGEHEGHAVLVGDVSRIALASLVTRTVDRWCHSADEEIEWWHCPQLTGQDERLQPAIRRAVVPHARDAWEDLKSAKGRLKFTHDMYLKMAQLDGWKPSEMAIMLDEAQDTNPVLADILLGNANKREIVVGDPNQAIYEWRGAQDAMAKFEAQAECGLTGSYRFGPGVAEEANLWLELLGTDLRLKGWKRLESQVVDRLPEGMQPSAVLTRTNGGAIVAAMNWLEAGRKVAVVGGGAEIESLARGAEALKSGRRSEHPDLVNFASWGDVQTYCKEEPEEAGTLVPLVRAIDTHGPAAIMRMARSLVSEELADVTVSTQHKSKGRQWEVVEVGTDFIAPKDGGEMKREEMRLAYVAVTRAQKVLATNALGEWIHGGR